MRQPRLSPRRRPRAIRVGCVCLCWLLVAVGSAFAGPPATPAAAPAFDADAPHRVLISRHCLGCHNNRLKTAGLELDALVEQHAGGDRATWEKVARKLRARQMPPPGRRRPDDSAYVEALSSLETELDRIAAESPDPGRTETFRRLNRTEYHNAIRDLLALEIDAAALLPGDSSSFGFDNVTVGDLSPTLLDAYVGAAEKISRLAVGAGGRADRDHLPYGSRSDPGEARRGSAHRALGAASLRPGTSRPTASTSSRSGSRVTATSTSRALREPHDLELLIDRERIETFTVEPPDLMSDVALNYQPSQDDVDDHLVVRVPVSAGPHDVGVTFPARPWVLLETARQPYESHFNYYRHPRVQPAIFSVSVVGPYLQPGACSSEQSEARSGLRVSGEVGAGAKLRACEAFGGVGAGDTPSRQRVFVCQPQSAAEEDGCARKILANLMRRAYRRPVADDDLRGPFALYSQAKADGGFEAGIEMGLAAVLVSPEFLFRIEREPEGAAAGEPYRISDLELASRLAFFLWSSIPDDELLSAAEAGELSDPDRLRRQVERMLADPRAENLVTNFAAQWLHLRNLDGVTPDKRLFPDFDENLRQSLRRETELFVGSILREDRSVLDLLRADYTFLNERLARHYGIPHIVGSRFRRVELGDDSVRGGLLRHGSILTVTSFATRTSPVVRGNWVLDNLLGVPPPPPPPDIPDLPKAKIVARELPIRERLSAHRDNPACSGCHRLMDPVGFALENYDAIGRWRTVDTGQPIDASGELWDGSAFDGVAELEAVLMARPELFLTTLTEKLLVFATGRGVTANDGPAVRSILRQAEADDYRMSSLIEAIVESDPFQMRRASS